MDRKIEADIPFTGEEPIITELLRMPYETTVKKIRLPRETISRYYALIEKYDITGRIGKPSAPPKIFDDDHTHDTSLLTLIFDEGSTADITFREAPEDTGTEAAVEFRKLYFDAAKSDNVISEEKFYPDLKECRGIKEEHGPVTALGTNSYSSGMMYNSNQTVTNIIEKVKGKDGFVLVTVKKQAGNMPEASDSKEIASDILSKVQEISDKENLPAWNYVCKDPSIPVDTSMMVMDYSHHSSINIFYDDSLITGCPRTKCTIGETACKMGGAEVEKKLSDMINECVLQSGITVAMPQYNPYTAAQNNGNSDNAQPMNAFIGMGMGMFKSMPGAQGIVNQTSASGPAPVSNEPWECKCGEKGNTGKFCTECGSPRV